MLEVFHDYFSQILLVPIYHMYQSCLEKKLSLHQELKDILLAFLKVQDSGKATLLLNDIILQSVQPCAAIKSGPSGGIMFSLVQGHRNMVDPSVFIELLKSLEDQDVAGELFVKLIEKYAIYQHNEEEEE